MKFKIKNKIIIFGFLSEIIYLLFYLIEPLKRIFNDGGITLNNNILFLLVILLLLTLLALYIFAYRDVIKDKINIKIIFGFFILFNITLLFIWPIGSNDIFSYIYFSRVLSEHHTNPFFVAYSTLTNDDFYYFINNKWSVDTTPYGPPFIIIGSLIAFIGSKSLLLTLFLLKGFFIVTNILNFILIYKIFNSKKVAFLYAWNPLILYEFAINGHNDVLTIFFLLLCFYFIFKKPNNLKGYLAALFFLLVSILTKFITLIFLPLFLLIILFKIKPIKEKIYFIFSSAFITFFTFFIFYFPFWEGWQTLSMPIARSNSGFGLTIYSSLLILTTSALLFYLFKITDKSSTNPSIIISKIFFVISYCFLLLKIFFNRNKITNSYLLKYFIISLFLFYLSFFTWLMPWYFTVLIALLACYSAISNRYKYNRIIYGLTLYGILYYLVLR
jgi:hypothetical protein